MCVPRDIASYSIVIDKRFETPNTFALARARLTTTPSTTTLKSGDKHFLMPPKVPRGRGSARARGTARGQAAASPSDATGDATPQNTDPLPTESVVAKHDHEEDTKLAGGAGDDMPGTGEGDNAESSSRPSVQRIGSLQGSVPPSRSASPSVRGRGSAARGKRGMVKPTFTGRRTKEEREALAKELKEREELRNAERNAANEKKSREAKFQKKRDESRLQRARGGYSGAVSGPFSLGSSAQGRLL